MSVFIVNISAFDVKTFPVPAFPYSLFFHRRKFVRNSDTENEELRISAVLMRHDIILRTLSPLWMRFNVNTR